MGVAIKNSIVEGQRNVHRICNANIQNVCFCHSDATFEVTG